MRGIPSVIESDVEDVAWALQTADTLWKRGEKADAVMWLRRAAQAAGDASDDVRAVELARCAATLKDELEGRVSLAPPPLAPPPLSSAPTASPPIAASIEPESLSLAPDELLSLAPDSLKQSLGQVAAVPIVIPKAPRLPGGPPPIPKKPPPPIPAPTVAEVAQPAKASTAAMLEAEAAPPLPVRQPSRHPPSPPTYPPRVHGEEAESSPTLAGVAPPPASSVLPPAMPSSMPPAELPAGLQAGLQAGLLGDMTQARSVHLASNSPAAMAASPPLPLLGLEQLTALAALSVAARAELSRTATVVTLAIDDEAPTGGLALVLSGAASITAAMMDVAAASLEQGALLRLRGTLEAHVSLRLVASMDDTRIAIWSEDALRVALAQTPQIEQALRSAGDTVQALCGATIGALGERLDADLLAQVTSRLQVAVLAPDELLIAIGKAHPGLVVVAAGELELEGGVADGSSLSSGEFLFPEQVMSGGKTPSSVRAGAKGALLLVGSRATAQELLVTCAPLLEIFAGM